MQKLLLFVLLFTASIAVQAQSPVGKWKVISHTMDMNGKKVDMHAALLQSKPCVAKVVYEINADGTYRLNASASGCDKSYIDMQEKMNSKTEWRLAGDLFTTSATKFAVGQTYQISFSGNNMTWVGTDGQGTIVYQKL